MKKPLFTNPVFWLALPVLFLLVHMILQLTLPVDVLKTLLREDGIYEDIQFMFIFSAFIVYARTLIGLPIHLHRWLAMYVSVAVAACFYVAGEEISWGQRIFGWATSAEWQALNDHGETNLHNTSSWIDQKPKIILQYAILLGGLIIPFLRRARPGLLPARFNALYPPDVFTVTAFCLLVLKLTKELDDAYNLIGFERLSEVNELYMYYFVFLYALYLRATLKSRP